MMGCAGIDDYAQYTVRATALVRIGKEAAEAKEWAEAQGHFDAAARLLDKAKACCAERAKQAAA